MKNKIFRRRLKGVTLKYEVVLRADGTAFNTKLNGEPIIDVRRYGAVADGVTDCAAAFQKAIEASVKLLKSDKGITRVVTPLDPRPGTVVALVDRKESMMRETITVNGKKMLSYTKRQPTPMGDKLFLGGLPHLKQPLVEDELKEKLAVSVRSMATSVLEESKYDEAIGELAAPQVDYLEDWTGVKKDD